MNYDFIEVGTSDFDTLTQDATDNCIDTNFYHEILAGLKITTYFFENKLLTSINNENNNYLPKARNRFIEMIEKL